MAPERFMRAALALARRGLGNTWPNPAVGCVLVRDEVVVGRGWTQPGGRPHAETEALRRAGPAARGATAFVTLEPCAHTGATAPCAEALVAAGIARCVVALEDPDPRVAGRGLAHLGDAGVEVALGCCADEAAALNAGYLMHRRQGRPMVTWKIASSLDGCIATAAGDSRWITGDAARARAHLLRARHDAVMVGARTAIADQPRLTCRLAGLEAASPVRVIADSRLRLPLTDPLVTEAGAVPSWVLALAGAERGRKRAFTDAGVEVIEVAAGEGGLDMATALAALARRGVTRLMVEGGGRLAASLLRADLVDRIAWFRAPIVLGGDGVPAAAALGLAEIAAGPRFRRTRLLPLDDDVLEDYVRLRDGDHVAPAGESEY
ncbi:MAG TPA: bifunctional diaminohydroxyphosphoribosylaminopyrimidine deaminase/5-amino-6-(5-phosphoribosylamino)uracil reductase RibD [Alphaproteobacteria bacterium]